MLVGLVKETCIQSIKKIMYNQTAVYMYYVQTGDRFSFQYEDQKLVRCRK